MRGLVHFAFLAVVGCVVLPALACAACGDGVLEREYELCDDGAANGTNGCCTNACDFVDLDEDGICDAVDPCVESSAIVDGVALVVKGFATERADDAFRLTATLVASAPLDLASTGFAFALGNRYWGAFAHAAIPSGTAWRPAARGGWSYRDPQGTAGGITSVKIKGRGHGAYALKIDGRRGSYAAWADIRPVHVTVALAVSGAGADACGETYLSLARCGFPASGNTMRCVPPSLQRRCGDDPDARVRCDAQNAVAAEEAYFEREGRYLSGSCAGLPGFVSSPETICVATGSETDFVLTTAGPNATIACVYDTWPPPASLVCS